MIFQTDILDQTYHDELDVQDIQVEKARFSFFAADDRLSWGRFHREGNPGYILDILHHLKMQENYTFPCLIIKRSYYRRQTFE